MLIASYLLVIVLANLLLAVTGSQWVLYFNAFVFIGFSITSKDILQERWQNHLKRNMFFLILAGSVLSALMAFIFTPQGLPMWRVILASFLAFAGNEALDVFVYQKGLERGLSRFTRINLSNIPSALVDSLIFPIVLFGWPPIWSIVLGQFLAKFLGGLLWSIFLHKKNT